MNVPRAFRELIQAHDPEINCVLRMPIEYDQMLPLAELLTVPCDALPETWEVAVHVRVTVYGRGLSEAFEAANAVRTALNGPAVQTSQGLLDDVFPVQEPTEIGWPHESIVAVEAIYGAVYRVT